MRTALLTVPYLSILNLPVGIISSRSKGEDTMYELNFPMGHPKRYSQPWDAWGTQYVREIKSNDTLWQLFLNGPTFDGDMVSKSERDEMYGLGLVARYNGYQSLTEAGLEVCMRLEMDRQKDKHKLGMKEAVHG